MNKKSKVAVAGVAAVALVGGTLAYWSSTTTINNPFSTNSYGGETVEEFNPKEGDGWEPGGTVDKVVSVNNTGDYSIFARVRFEETWTRKDTNEDGEVEVVTLDGYPMYSNTEDGKKNTLFFPTSAAAIPAEGGSVVYKEINTNTTDWIDGKDGYYYSTEILAGDDTDALLQSVTLLPETDMGTYVDVNWVSLDGENWEKGKLIVTENEDGSQTVTIDYDNPKRLDEEITDPNQTIYQKVETMLKSDEKGYADADYVLTIVTELCQSTEDEEGNAIPTKWPMPTTASN